MSCCGVTRRCGPNRPDRYPFTRGIAQLNVEIGGQALPTLSRSGCRIRKGEQRHDEHYHAFIDAGP
jgi:hypothetical protein